MAKNVKTKEEQIKRQHKNRFKTLFLGADTQKKKEEILIGENYILRGHLAQSKEQVTEIEERINISKRFSVIDNKLAFDGVICEEEA